MSASSWMALAPSRRADPRAGSAARRSARAAAARGRRTLRWRSPAPAWRRSVVGEPVGSLTAWRFARRSRESRRRRRASPRSPSRSSLARSTRSSSSPGRRPIPDQVLRDLGEIGALGLYVDRSYGGQGLSQTGYARVFETVGQIDATLAIVLGVHQSIGFKGISLFGTDEQKERWLPDLATGRKLAAFALTETEAGSDAYHVRSRAVEQPDGSWLLNGEKRYIGNGSRADVITTFARAEVGGKDRHIALLLEKGMKGLEVGERYDTMGLRGNDLRRLYFKDVRVPPENVLGEPGEGFRVAMQILNNGRIGLGTGSVGATKKLLDLSIDHVKERRQFHRPLADFELVQDKIGWMVSNLFGLESMCYLTCGLVDAGVEDYSLESAICKVSGTEFL